MIIAYKYSLSQRITLVKYKQVLKRLREDFAFYGSMEWRQRFKGGFSDTYIHHITRILFGEESNNDIKEFIRLRFFITMYDKRGERKVGYNLKYYDSP